MAPVTQTLAVTIKELRELFHRPLLVVVLIFGPMALMLVFGVGTSNVVEPPHVIVVVPPGQEQPRLVQEHQREFNRFLNVQAYTDDLEWAREQLAQSRVNAVVVLPPTPYETIASGRQAEVRVYYSEIDPARRSLVRDFVRVMVGDINRELFLQNADAQQNTLDEVLRDIERAVRAVDAANDAINRGDRDEARRQVEVAQAASAEIDDSLALLGPEAAPFRAEATRLRTQLQEANRRLAAAERRLATPDPRPLSEQVGLAQLHRDLRSLGAALERLTSIPPEVAIAPLAAEAEDVTPIEADVISYFAPAILAMLLQHAAVSLGALALVRERLAGTFELYTVAPTSNLQLLVGKYLAYLLFTLVISAALLGVLISPLLNVPLFGSPWQVALTLFLLALASIGLGLAFSLLATSERQAVQFAMLALLGVMFFSGIALPLDALLTPALVCSYALPATYGVQLLQDIMLRGIPGSGRALLILAAMAAGLFVACLALLRWRTRMA